MLQEYEDLIGASLEMALGKHNKPCPKPETLYNTFNPKPLDPQTLNPQTPKTLNPYTLNP